MTGHSRPARQIGCVGLPSGRVMPSQSTMPNDPLNYYPAANPVFCWFTGGFVALLGAAFGLSGVMEVGHDPLTGITQFLVAVAVLFIAWRIARYPARAVLSLTDDALIRRPAFWRTTTVPFAEIAGLGRFDQHNRARMTTPSHFGSVTGQTVTSEHLVITLKSGGTRTITLPEIVNADLLAELTARTGLPIEEMSARKAG